MRAPTKIILRWTIVFVVSSSIFMWVIGCSSKKETPECVEATAASSTDNPAKEKQGSTEKRAAGAAAVNIEFRGDWCRACVLGPNGYMSCQTARASSSTETREQIKKKSIEQACEDSGFPKENCPGNAVISVSCLGDPPPKDKAAAGRALLEGLKHGPPVKLTNEPPAEQQKPKSADKSAAAPKTVPKQ